MALVLYDRVEEARAFLKQKGLGPVDAAVVADAELDPLLALAPSASVSFGEVPGFPRGSRIGDARVEAGDIDEVRVIVIHGRVFGYEGVSLAEATIPIRAAAALGAKWIALAGAVEALDASWKTGDVVFSTDQLNWMGDNPLMGPHLKTDGQDLW